MRTKSDFSAKHKLNAAHFRSAFVLAASIAFITGSPAAFALVLAVILALGLVSGAIRK